MKKIDPALAILIREFGDIPPQQHIQSDAEAVEWMERYESDELHILQAVAKQINEASKQRETIKSDNTEVVYSLLGIIADIRQKTGVGDKVMLGELAETLGRLLQNGQSAIDTNQAMGNKLKEMDELLRQCAVIVENQARQDWGQQKLLAGFAPCEPDSPAIRLWEMLREKGYSIWK